MLDLVEEIRRLSSTSGLERRNHSLEGGVIERGAQARILEVHEQALLSLEVVALDQLGQQGRLAASPDSLHHEGELGRQLLRELDSPRHRGWRRSFPVAPVLGDGKK
jgi:hypothetical protein